jgi:threonine dehydratase
VRVIGVEAAASPAVSSAVRGVDAVDVQPTLADGLAGNLEPGSITVDLVRRLVPDIVTVDEDQIEDGMRFLAREHGIVAEGSGAVGVAAVLHGQIAPQPTMAVVITGRNIALDRFSAVVNAAGAREPLRR